MTLVWPKKLKKPPMSCAQPSPIMPTPSGRQERWSICAPETTTSWPGLTNRAKQFQKASLKSCRRPNCRENTPSLPHSAGHHALVGKAVQHYSAKHQAAGQLGSRSGARYRVYERLSAYEREAGLLQSVEMKNAIGQIYKHPLQDAAKGQLNKLLRMKVSDNDLAECVLKLYEGGRLCIMGGEKDDYGAQIICSLGIIKGGND